MRIFEKSITREESIRLCTKIYHIAQIRPRVRELLDQDYDPKYSPLARQIAKQLTNGKIVVINRGNGEIFTCRQDQVDAVPDLELTPGPDPEIKIYAITNSSKKTIGPISLGEFEELIPTFNPYETFFWHNGIEDFVKLSDVKERLIG